VYFPRRVIPMLPEALSNELCSLKPKVDRLVMVCEMDITANGAVQKHEFYAGVIHSQARLTYTRVAAVLEGREAEPPVEAKLVPHLETLNGVFHSLLGSRSKRGAIDFDSVETQMIFDEQGKIERIVRVQRNDAHRLIEECMLAANVCASDFLEKNEQPTLYRVHEGPDAREAGSPAPDAEGLRLSLGGGDEPQAKDYQALLSRIKGKPVRRAAADVMLRSLRQAVYSRRTSATSASPTRRTRTSRRRSAAIRTCSCTAASRPCSREEYEEPDWNAIGNHCSETERRADEATRDVENWLKSYYMQDHVGDEFEGTISGVTNFGLFVTLDELFIDGLVHISDLGRTTSSTTRRATCCAASAPARATSSAATFG
jgi:ribonuclease R